MMSSPLTPIFLAASSKFAPSPVSSSLIISSGLFGFLFVVLKYFVHKGFVFLIISPNTYGSLLWRLGLPMHCTKSPIWTSKL